jgi:hypothetical protein
MPILTFNPERPDAVEAADASELAAIAGHDREHSGRPRSRDVVILRVEDRVAADLAGRWMGHVARSRRSMLQARLSSKLDPLKASTCRGRTRCKSSTTWLGGASWGSSESRLPWASERHRSGFAHSEIAETRFVGIPPRLGKPWLRSGARATRLLASPPSSTLSSSLLSSARDASPRDQGTTAGSASSSARAHGRERASKVQHESDWQRLTAASSSGFVFSIPDLDAPRPRPLCQPPRDCRYEH